MDYHITKIVGYVVDASSEAEAERIVRENELENPLAYFSKRVPFQFEDALKAFDRSWVVYVGDTVKLPNKHPWWGRIAEVVAVTETENDKTVLDVVCRQEWFEDAPVTGNIASNRVKLVLD